jgi:hypothetical protein
MVRLPFSTLRASIRWWWNTPTRLFRDLKNLDKERKYSEFRQWWDYPKIRKCSCGVLFPDSHCMYSCDECLKKGYPETHLVSRLKFAKEIFAKNWQSDELIRRSNLRSLGYLLKFLICILFDFGLTKSDNSYDHIEVACIGCTQGYEGDCSCEVLYVGEGFFKNWWWDYDWNA